MPIKIPKQLPARELLRQENIFVMDEDRAKTQDIRPLEIAILNLMPEKEKTELQLLRLLGNTPLQVNITFLHTETYESKNVSKSHLDTFYSTISDVRGQRFDGMIITGAPVELMPFEAVDYWQELTDIMEWTKEHVTSVFHICWGAQAALYYHYGIDKYTLENKCFGVYNHRVTDPTLRLIRGFNDRFLAPHSRHTSVSLDDIKQHPKLKIVSYSDEVGPFLIKSKDCKHIMMTGHLEYDATTLRDEYERDLKKGLDIQIPDNYFPKDDPKQTPLNTWRSHTHLLFSNWLNYYVYQETPYEWVHHDEVKY